MAINSQPVTALTNTDTTLTNQETAVSQLSALLLSVQDVTQTLGKASTYGSQTATSSDTGALAATVTGRRPRAPISIPPCKWPRASNC